MNLTRLAALLCIAACSVGAAVFTASSTAAPSSSTSGATVRAAAPKRIQASLNVFSINPENGRQRAIGCDSARNRRLDTVCKRLLEYELTPLINPRAGGRSCLSQDYGPEKARITGVIGARAFTINLSRHNSCQERQWEDWDRILTVAGGLPLVGG
ncbi:hypothetical protein DSM112329_03653 [Paraconexibacter sp. AEG42_29]|uniref:Subtilisin inhibitor domain-containing protein n=1 Tax=Paraconexibacter sp. AEG42_29 TaxID=2997339 RepID=A0AAU7AYF2_9ACTN